MILSIIRDNSDITIGTGRGEGGDEGGDEDIIIHNDSVFHKVLTKGELGLAEAYMDGDWTTRDLGKVLRKLLKYQDVFEEKVKNQSLQLIAFVIKYKCLSLFASNTLVSSANNIRTHYDVGNDLYEKMLGPSMQYTCAWYHKPDMLLDGAQLSKMELIATKLDLKPGQEVLDIGCGFGSMAHHLVTKYGVSVTGVTLSENQVKYAKQHYQHDQLDIQYLDYRKVQGTFDRVYSVGMFEHVGSGNYKEYFHTCSELLKDDGIMLCHTMSIAEPKHDQNKYFASTYIFPEGELPDIHNITKGYSDIWRLEDFQNMGISYSKTFDVWRTNIGDWSGLEQYDDRFKRMWEYYLHLFAENFRRQNFMLWQMVFTKKKHIRDDDCTFIRR
jgi:cyclopropane-fatty-acyl-phospholipid synthase